MPPKRVAAVLLMAHVFSMLGFATYAALLPELRDAWRLSNSEAGVVAGMLFGGYVATVPFWTALTDRIDARRIYAIGAILCALGSAGFGAFADGLASASAFQALLGAGIAATYMPGLRLLSDRIDGPLQSRYIAFYTSFFGVGASLSIVLAGATAPAWSWPAAFFAAALGPLAAGALVWRGLAPGAPASAPARLFSLETFFPIAAWRRALAQREVLGYTLGYAVHSVELFGSRGWLVAFLAFSATLQATASPWSATAIAAFVNLASAPASVLGNEAALRFGRRRWILAVMLGSGCCGVLLGGTAAWAWPVVLALALAYAMLSMADSAALTAGLIGAAPASLRGAAMGLYSLVGFAGAFIGPMLFGLALDAAGGGSEPAHWAIAYGAIGAGCLVAPLAMRLFASPRRA